MLSWGCREALSCGRREGAGVRLRREGRAASSSLRTASAQPAGSAVPVCEARSGGRERALERRERGRAEPDEGANGRQSKILLSHSSGIMCQSKILLCQSSWIVCQSSGLLWQSSGLLWQSSGLVSDKSAVVWQSKKLVWQSSSLVWQSSGITSDSSGML